MWVAYSYWNISQIDIESYVKVGYIIEILTMEAPLYETRIESKSTTMIL